jgi:hypothetical protein
MIGSLLFIEKGITMIKPTGGEYAAWVTSSLRNEIRFVGLLDEWHGDDDVDWPYWVDTYDSKYGYIYEKHTGPYCLFLEEFFKLKIKIR